MVATRLKLSMDSARVRQIIKRGNVTHTAAPMGPLARRFGCKRCFERVRAVLLVR